MEGIVQGIVARQFAEITGRWKAFVEVSLGSPMGLKWPECTDSWDALTWEHVRTYMRSVAEATAEHLKGKRMQCDIDLDWCTYTCPCGESLCTRFESDAAIARWRQAHKPHTDGTVLEHTTDNGNRAWASPEPDRVVPLK